MQQKLLQEPKLALNQCIDIAHLAKTTTAQLKLIAEQTEESKNEVNVVRKWQRNRHTNGPMSNIVSDSYILWQ